MLLFVYDELERSLPPPGHYRISDGNSQRVLHTRDSRLRAEYEARFDTHRGRLEDISSSYRMHFVPCTTQDDVPGLLRDRLGK